MFGPDARRSSRVWDITATLGPTERVSTQHDAPTRARLDVLAALRTGRWVLEADTAGGEGDGNGAGGNGGGGESGSVDSGGGGGVSGDGGGTKGGGRLSGGSAPATPSAPWWASSPPAAVRLSEAEYASRAEVPRRGMSAAFVSHRWERALDHWCEEPAQAAPSAATPTAPLPQLSAPVRALACRWEEPAKLRARLWRLGRVLCAVSHEQRTAAEQAAAGFEPNAALNVVEAVEVRVRTRAVEAQGSTAEQAVQWIGEPLIVRAACF